MRFSEFATPTKPFALSLSKGCRLRQAPFDKLRTGGFDRLSQNGVTNCEKINRRSLLLCALAQFRAMASAWVLLSPGD